MEVELAGIDGEILLRITDDGMGFDPGQGVTGLGLASMRQRVLAVGGAIDISSSPKGGTRIAVRVPFRTHGSGDVLGVA